MAGARAGLAGERSGLFMEQIRIIKEMRDADVLRGRTGIHVRPRFMCWENVPGAFSSGQQKGDDFRVVLKETLGIGVSGIHVPENHPWGWRYSRAAILGDFVSLCWRVLDAQYWGVPQSRKRIFLVADLGAHPQRKYYLSRKACLGILRRARKRGKELPATLELALEMQSGLRMIDLVPALF